MLGAVASTDDHDTGGTMMQPNRRIGDVPVLSTRPGSSESGDVALFFELVEVHVFIRTQNTERRKQEKIKFR